jgi:hypothetical protein
MPITVKNKDEWREFWLQCYGNRVTDADVGPNSFPWARASAIADCLSIQSANAQIMAGGIPLDSLTGDQLDKKYGEKLPRIVATKASNYITIECGSAGTTILNGDRLSFGSTRNQYEHTGATTLYVNGQSVPVRSVDPGSGQNVAAGTVLNWSLIRAGCYATCKVFEMPNGDGLTGGRDAESDEEYKNRIRAFNANPVGHGNEGDLLVLLEEAASNPTLGRPGHGVPVEKGFVYPAIRGPGTIGCTFLVKADEYWATRAPTSGQLTTVLNYVSQYMPSMDMIFMAPPLATYVNIDLKLTLDPRAAQWADAVPWPPYRARGSGMLVITAAPDALHFTIGVDSGTYSGVTPPAVGNSIALYDRLAGAFRRKKIGAISGTGPWDITVDTTSGVSDYSYQPGTSAAVSPWFDAINDVATAVGKTFAKLGPGEMTANDPGDGKRMMRVPFPAPASYPKDVTARLAYDVVNAVQSISDGTFLRDTQSAPVGDTAGVYLVTLFDLGLFKS